jgi:hypothetical protein
MNPEVKAEIVKRLKSQLCEVNREVRNFTGDMETDPKFEALVVKRAELKAKVKSFE